jgi:hypothetical protein
VRFEDGTIEFDVRLTRRRSFVYVHFRADPDGEREEFYLRPHKSDLPDAVQYAPVWQNRSAWQLYHGPGGTASVALDTTGWTHVRVVVRGRQAALFVGDMARPALLVPQLAREPRAGYLALGAFTPPDAPGDGPSVRFANVAVGPGSAAFDVAAAPQRHVPLSEASRASATIVRRWSVSRGFSVKDDMLSDLPAASLTGEFQVVEAEDDGLLPLERHVRVPEGSRVATVVARVRVRAARDGIRVFDLGFSDIATVFLNGRPVFRGDASYSFDRPRRDGLIGYDQARLYLPLVAGENDVAIVISDSFGGWGVMGRFADGEGLMLDEK